MRLVVNAVNLAPGGGLTGLLGYIKAWQTFDDIEVSKVFVGRQEVIKKLQERCPGCATALFMPNVTPFKRFLAQQRLLGAQIDECKADAVMCTQYGVARCRTPQLIHHRNLKRFEHTVSRRIMCLQFGELLKDIAARRSLAILPVHAYISDYLRLEAEKVFPQAASRNHTVYNGLSDSLIKIAPTLINHGAESGRLLALQATGSHKDNPTLLHVLKRLHQKAPNVDWHLDIAGFGDWKPFEQIAESLGIRNKVTFHGYVDHDSLNQFFDKALCLVFPSRLEGFGNPPLEAMAHQCPVVASDCTAIPEVVGNAGILVPPGDADAFANAVIELQQDADKRAHFVHLGLERIRLFSWETSARKMLNLLKSISMAR